MSSKLTKPPIFYTVGQIRFNPVLDMPAYVPDLQAAFRKTYPDFQSEDVNTFHVLTDPEGGRTPELKPVSVARWHFKNAQRTAGYVLMTDSIVFHTTAYIDSACFLKDVISGLETLNSKVSLSYVEGVGIRTLDAVVPDFGRTLSEYLQPGLLGIYADLEGEIRHSIFETMLDGIYGTLNCKVAFINGNVGVPYDLAPITLRLGESVQGDLGKHAILDNDCFQLDRFAYDVSEVRRRLRIVKSGASQPFYKSVTAFALENWR